MPPQGAERAFRLLLPRLASGGSGGAIAPAGTAAAAAGAVGAPLPVGAGLILSPLLLERLLPGLAAALLGAAGWAAAELGLFALAGRLLAGRPLVLTGLALVLILTLGLVLPLGAGAAGTAAPGLGGALLPLVGGGLRLTQLLGRTAWEGVLQGHGKGVGFLLGLVLLGGTAELGQLL